MKKTVILAIVILIFLGLFFYLKIGRAGLANGLKSPYKGLSGLSQGLVAQAKEAWDLKLKPYIDDLWQKAINNKEIEEKTPIIKEELIRESAEIIIQASAVVREAWEKIKDIANINKREENNTP